MHAPRLLSDASAISLGLTEASMMRTEYLDTRWYQWGEYGQFRVETFDEWGRSMSEPHFFDVFTLAYAQAEHTYLIPGEYVQIMDTGLDQEIHVRWWGKDDEISYMHNLHRANCQPRYPWETDQWLKGLNP